jgi:hypothetical protein
MVDPTTATGTCAVCIVDKERSLVANLAAANNFKVSRARQHAHLQATCASSGNMSCDMHHIAPVLCPRLCCCCQLQHLSCSAPLLPHSCPPQVSHIEQPENWAAVEAAKVIYSAGFFITVSPDAIAKTSQHCCEKGKIYCMVRGWLGPVCRMGGMGPAAHAWCVRLQTWGGDVWHMMA